MPEPPEVGFVTRYIFESPYLLGTGLLLLALVLLWLGLRDGRSDRLRIMLVPLLLGIAVLVVGGLVVTSGEHADRVTREIVEAVVSSDFVAVDNLLAHDATLHVRSPRNPGYDHDFIISQISRPEIGRIQSHTITNLESYSASADRGVVHLACRTEDVRFFAMTRWVLEVRRTEAGAWKVSRITWVSINNASPSGLIR